MKTTNPDNQDWQKCPPGAIDGMVRQLRSQRRHQRVQAIGAFGGVAALLLAFTLFVMHRSAPQVDGEVFAGGIWCNELIADADEYLAGRLDAARTRRIEDHLAECPHCRALLEDMRRMESSTPTSGPDETGTGPQIDGRTGIALRTPPPRRLALAAR